MSKFIAPHFNLPFRLYASVDCVEQDTLDDITNGVVISLGTDLGIRPEAPTVGVNDYTFRNQPIGKDLIIDEIVASEPRAQVLVTEHPDVLDSLIDRVQVQVSGGGQ